MWGAPGTMSVQSAPPNQQVPMNVPKKVLRINEQSNWSAYRYEAAQALAGRDDAVFQTAIGSVGQNWGVQLSIAETNLEEQGRISNARAYLVDAIGLHPYYYDSQGVQGNSVSARDLFNIQANCTLAWRFIQTVIQVAPAVLVGTGGGVYGASADTGGNYGGGGSQVALNHGLANLWFYRKNPVMLPGGTNFSFRYIWGSYALPVDGGPNDLDLVLRTMLLGTYTSAVPMG